MPAMSDQCQYTAVIKNIILVYNSVPVLQTGPKLGSAVIVACNCLSHTHLAVCDCWRRKSFCIQKCMYTRPRGRGLYSLGFRLAVLLKRHCRFVLTDSSCVCVCCCSHVRFGFGMREGVGGRQTDRQFEFLCLACVALVVSVGGWGLEGGGGGGGCC